MRIESSLRGLLTVFFRQFWKFVFVAGGIAFAVAAYLAYAPHHYESSGTLLVKFGSDARPDISKNDAPQPDIAPNDRREMIESYTRILQSRDLLVGLIKEIGVAKLYPGIASSPSVSDEGTAVELAYNALMKGDLVVKVGVQSNLIELHVQNTDPKLAQQFLKRLCEQFMVRQAQVFSMPQVEFINEQVQHASEELKKAQTALQEYKTKYGLSSVEEEMNRLMQEKSEAKTVALRSIDEAQTKVDELRAKETQLLMTYQADSPAVMKLRESLDMAQTQLIRKQQDLKAGTVGAGGESTSTVAPHIKDLDKRIAQLEARRGEYNDLERQVQISEDHYKQYSAKLEDARLKDTLNRQNITRLSILDEPNLPLKPIKPNKRFILALGLLAALLSGLGIAILFETLDERFSRQEQLAAVLGAPVMASFPRVRIRRRRRSKA